MKPPKNDQRTVPLYGSIGIFSLSSSLLISFLAFHKYPFFYPEAILIFAAFFVLALIYFGIAAVCRPLALFIFLIFGLIYAQIILSMDFTNFFFMYDRFIYPLNKTITKNGVFFIGLIYNILFFTGFAFLYIGITKARRDHWKIIAIFSAVTLISTGFSWVYSPPLNIIKTPQHSDVKRVDKPSVLHIIFDEHASVKWLPEGVREAQLAEQEMRSFYEKYDFLLFENAFSHYYWSEESISNALNLTAWVKTNSVKRKKTKEIGKKFALTENKIFDHFSGLGYQLRAYYSDYLDLCAPGNDHMEYCFEYKSNSSGYIKNTPIPMAHKSAIIFEQFLRSNMHGAKFLSFLKYNSVKYFDKKLSNVPIIGKPYYRTGPLATIDTLQQLKEDIARYPRGTVFLAHLLTPHHPFMFDSENNLKKDPRTWVSIHYVYKNQVRPSRNEQYRTYYEQVRGLYKVLDDWFEEMDRDGYLQDLKVIFHGDHGSRIGKGAPTIRMVEDEDWVRTQKDVFSTVFAIKDPEIPKGTTDISKPIELLLSQYLFEPADLRRPYEGRGLIFVQEAPNNRKKYYKIKKGF